MITIIKNGSSQEEIQKAFERHKKKPKKGFEASKFSGILKLSDDPMEIQRKLRNEWK